MGMVISTELCALSEYRIYPGNGKLMWLGTSKAYSLTLQRKKPAKLVWTQAWRRLHKKGLSEAAARKKSRKRSKVQRAVVGLSLDDIRKRAAQKPEFRNAQREAALKEVKTRKIANKSAKSNPSGRSGKSGSKTIQNNKGMGSKVN